MEATPGDTPKKKKAAGKKKAANGKADSANGKTLAFPPRSKPGDQGLATQEEEPTVQGYEPKEPSAEELAVAKQVYESLKAKGTKAPEDVVAQLVSIVDVHPKLRTPELFGGKDEAADIYAPADVAKTIAGLLRQCPKIQIGTKSLVFWFVDREKWTSAGHTVAAQVKRYDKYHQYVSEGIRAAVLVNYHHWKTLNPRQKVFTVYHALREMDVEGKAVAPDFEGYFEEPAIFGAGVHREMVTMARAFVKDAPARAAEPFQLSILDEVYD